MNASELSARRELEDEILHYVRHIGDIAPITDTSVYAFVTRNRRRRVTETEVRERLLYMIDKEWLRRDTEFEPGEGDVDYLHITALGMDVLDKVKPRD